MIQARDIMTTNVVTVTPEATMQDVARVLLEHKISAAPVVDGSGALVGMVSEGDLVGRSDADRDERRDWWLNLIAEGEALSPDFLKTIKPKSRTAAEVMNYPVVTVAETVTLPEIIKLLQTYRIKRLPVVRDGVVVGIVSRADVLRAQLDEIVKSEASNKTRSQSLLSQTLSRIDQEFMALTKAKQERAAPMARAEAHPPAPTPSADDLRTSVAAFKQKTVEERLAAKQKLIERRKLATKDIVTHHIDDAFWDDMLDRAKTAAEHGETESLMLKFPAEACSDGGRAINVPEEDWPETLQGEAAEAYLRWRRELRPKGYRLHARIMDFPDGLPGDIGLFLSWGGKENEDKA